MINQRKYRTWCTTGPRQGSLIRWAAGLVLAATIAAAPAAPALAASTAEHPATALSTSKRCHPHRPHRCARRPTPAPSHTPAPAQSPTGSPGGEATPSSFPIALEAPSEPGLYGGGGGCKC